MITAKRLTTALLLILVLILVLPVPVHAIADPDTPPQVNAVYVYENVLESGDVGVLVDYYLDYAVLPTETATEAFMAVFVDTDGATQLKSVAPYTFVDSGYGRGLIWIYFTAAEAATYVLDDAQSANYRIWLVGNPTLAWAGDPPRTIATIDAWTTVSDPSGVIASRVLYYADQLEQIWSLDIVTETAAGNRLSSTGESYFTNVIANLRYIAPNVFSSVETDPLLPTISYDTVFGATATSGTATIVGSPVTLASGANTIDTGATTGTIVLTLAGWTFGEIEDGTGTLNNSPITINPGVNTVTVTGAGTFTVTVAVRDTVQLLSTSAVGTALDLTTSATAFGMSRWFFSGLIWILITVIICAVAYRGSTGEFGDTGGAIKVVSIIFAVSVVGGSLLGLLHPLVSALLFIMTGAFIGYVFFFRSDSLHKGFMFMAWVWLITSIAGNILAGSIGIVATRLDANVAAGTINSITVASTEGFPDAGYIVIDDEIIGYPEKTATTFQRSSVLGVTTNPILRAQFDTEDAAHAVDATVRMREASYLNASLDYKIARIVDNAGLIDFLTLPARLLGLVMTFFTLPLGFLGTDLAVFTYVWAVISAGFLVGFVSLVVGGRRV